MTVIRNRNLFNSDNRGRTASSPIFAGQWSESGDDYADRFIGDAELSNSVWNMAPNLSLASSLLTLKDFRLAGSIPVSEAQSASGFRSLDICNSAAEAIRKLPLLEADETDIGRRIMPDVLWSDGNRLVAGGGDISLHKPWPMVTGMAFNGNWLDPAYLPITVTAYSRSLADDGNSSTVSASANSPRYSLLDSFPHFLYSSDPGTYKLEVRQGGNSWSLPMRRHPSLPGAFWMGDLEHSKHPEPESLPELFIPDTHPANAANRLYAASVGIPFSFDGLAEVGEGGVRFIAPAFRSMSSGQFGQFPLYVFSEGGIWALPSSANGAPVRISADEAKSVAVAGTIVAYSTDAGVYALTGTQCECISSAMQGCGDPWLVGCEEVGNLLRAEGIAADWHSFAAVLADGKLIFDSASGILYLGNGAVAFAYYIADKGWGMASTGNKAFILTRPIKLGSPASRKRLTAVALTGPLSLRSTKVAALGSDDLRHWRLLGTGCGTAITAMRGTGARYIAIAACAELKDGQTISGCTFFY